MMPLEPGRAAVSKPVPQPAPFSLGSGVQVVGGDVELLADDDAQLVQGPTTKGADRHFRAPHSLTGLGQRPALQVSKLQDSAMIFGQPGQALWQKVDELLSAHDPAGGERISRKLIHQSFIGSAIHAGRTDFTADVAGLGVEGPVQIDQFVVQNAAQPVIERGLSLVAEHSDLLEDFEVDLLQDIVGGVFCLEPGFQLSQETGFQSWMVQGQKLLQGDVVAGSGPLDPYS